MLPLPHPVFLSSLAADRPPAERVRQEECVCARAAAESGVCVVPSGGEREEEGGGVEQTAHAHCEGAAERAAGNTHTHSSLGCFSASCTSVTSPCSDRGTVS